MFRRAMLAMALVVAAGCDSGGTTGTDNHAIAISLPVSAVEITQAGTTDIAVNVARSGGFTGPVSLTAQDLPVGVTAAPGTIEPGSTTGTITLSAAADAVPAPATVTIRGTATGLTPATATLGMAIKVRGTYSLSANPAAVAIVQGGTTTSQITINREGGFAGGIAMGVAAPAGITATLTAGTGSGISTSTLTLVAAATAPVGTHALTITATTPGLPDRTLTMDVAVRAPGGFQLGVTPSAVAVAAGGQATAAVAVTRINGFAGAVAITASAPTGLTATVAPASITGTQAVLTVVAAAGMAAGEYEVLLTGSSDGAASQFAAVPVTVQAAGSFSVTLSPTALAVQQGGSATSQVTVARTGSFAGAVALTASAPAGVTVTFAPAAIAAGSTQSTMTVAAAAGAAVGTGKVTLTASAVGLTAQSVELALTVNQSDNDGGNVTWQFCGFSGLPQFVAAQDGNGGWARVNGSASNAYSFQISSGRGAIAYVLPSDDGGWDTQVFYGTTAELQTMGSNVCWNTTGGLKTVSGSVTPALGALELAFVTLGRTQAQVLPNNSAFTLQALLDGPLDLVAARSALNLSVGGYVPDRFLVQRNLNPATGATLAPIDLASAPAPAAANLTYSNLMGDWTSSVGLFQTSRNTQALLYTTGGATSAATRPWYGVSAGQRIAGDLHIVNAVATEPTGSNTSDVRTRQVMFVSADVKAVTVDLGPRLAAPAVNVIATAPYVRFGMDYTVVNPYHRQFVSSYTQGSAATGRTATMQKTSSYIDAGGATRIEVPDLSAVTGWNNDWGLKPAVATSWVLTATGWDGSGIVSPVLVDGATLKSGTRMGTITP